MIGKASVILVFGFAMLLGYVSLNMNRLATRSVSNMSSYVEATVSHNLAVTGANIGVAKFYSDTTWYGTISQTFTHELAPGSYTATMQDIGGGKLRLQSISSYPVASVGTLHDTVEVYFDKDRSNSFSIFAWMTNIEGNVWWITHDTVWGRTHSNDWLQMTGRPVFMDKVTTRRGITPRPGRSGNNAIFKRGYETGVAKIDFPDDLSELYNAATTASNPRGRYFNLPSIWVDITPGTPADNDGMVYVRSSSGGAILDSLSLSDPTFNGVVMGKSQVNVQGTLDGQLTVASAQSDIKILDDLIYERDPQSTPSNDMLGLVAERDIVVADNWANNHSCTIQASVFARNGSFEAEHYSTRPVSGELRILGSIVQDRRGPVGTFNGSGNIVSGFSKRYRYDNRLSDVAVRPPFYPGFYTRSFAIVDWWESYRPPSVLEND